MIASQIRSNFSSHNDYKTKEKKIGIFRMFLWLDFVLVFMAGHKGLDPSNPKHQSIKIYAFANLRKFPYNILNWICELCLCELVILNYIDVCDGCEFCDVLYIKPEKDLGFSWGFILHKMKHHEGYV
ncbi:hypothetical protein ACJX0J_016839, partial [Zea mays]